MDKIVPGKLVDKGDAKGDDEDIIWCTYIDTAIILVVKACVYKSVLDDKCQLFFQLVEEVQSLTLLAYPMHAFWMELAVAH